MSEYKLHLGNCLDHLEFMPDNSVDSIVTDPPYGLSFMGKKWDYDVPAVEIWAECLRVLKPGGHLLAFAGTRTQHRMACNIEDAGFEIRDMIAWVYGSGFPKSLDVSKAIDKAAGAQREVLGEKLTGKARTNDGWNGGQQMVPVTAPATEAARQWEGWGTALKPALEPVTVARKPFKGTAAANVLEHGTGAINIDGCRVPFAGEQDERESKQKNKHGDFGSGPMSNKVFGEYKKDRDNYDPTGRWPANLIHDGHDWVVALFPESSVTGKRSTKSQSAEVNGTNWLMGNHKSTEYADQGSAARFFYCAKASKKDRGEGNNHPTVKPTDLMAYLCRLVTPPGGIVLDPFMGSGSTGKAAMREGFRFTGIEMDPDYFEIAKVRIKHEANKNTR